MRARLVAGIAAVALIIAAIVGWKTCRTTESRSTAAQSGGAAQGDKAGGAKRKDRGGPVVPASLSGRVTRASDGGGIAGAVVTLAPADLMKMFMESGTPTQIAVTDASGAWKAQVQPGSFVIAATASGFLPGKRDKLVVAAGEQRQGLDLALTAGGIVVSGTVTDVLGGPIADARVTAKVDNEVGELWGRASFATTTNAEGRYELTLAENEYTLHATHDDYTSDSEDVEVKGTPAPVDFTLIPGAVVRGQVIARDTGQPVPGALVRAEAGNDNEMVAADEQGNFTLRGLSAGAVELNAMGRGYASSSPTVVSIGIGEQTDGVKVLVERAYSISGRVVRKGKPNEGLPGVMLGAFSIAAKSFGMALEPSATDGAFEIVGLKPASYLLGAIGEGSVPDIGKNVEVVDKDVENVIVELSTGSTIAGRVEPAREGASISLELAGQIGLANMFEAAKTMFVRGQTDATGAFKLVNAPPGAFKLKAMAPDGYAGELSLVVVDGVEQSGLVIKLESRASVSGRVIDTNGKPVAGVHVNASKTERTPGDMNISFGGRRAGNVTTAADGSFKLVGLEPSKYRIRATHSGEWDFEMPRKDAPARKDTVELELTATTVKTGVTLTVDAQDGVIRGTVVLPDKKPAADAWVTARRVREKPAGLPKGIDDKFDDYAPSSAPVLTNADGQFTINKLRRGTYKLIATGPRGASRAERPDVKTGDNVTIQLAALGTLSGKVTAGGKPVAKYDIECDGPGRDAERSITAADGAYTLERLAPGSYKCDVTSDAGTATAVVTIPAGPATQDFVLKQWASVTGVVVSVLDKKPIAGVIAVASAEGGSSFDSDMFGNMIGGKLPTTDPNGRFTLPRVNAGKGKINVMPKDGFSPLGSKEYTVVEGQKVDVGTIEIVPPRSGDAGTFGFATSVEGDKLVVTSVKPDGPAAVAGMREGDKITAMNGTPVAQLTPPVAQQLVSSGTVGIGQRVALSLDRGGTPVQVTLVSVKW